MILSNILSKISAKKMAFLTQTTAIFPHKFDHNIVFFLRKDVNFYAEFFWRKSQITVASEKNPVRISGGT
jgi:hypothetical protein